MAYPQHPAHSFMANAIYRSSDHSGGDLCEKYGWGLGLMIVWGLFKEIHKLIINNILVLWYTCNHITFNLFKYIDQNINIFGYLVILE